ncbi:MAG: ABC transporter permease [bacterium]
MRRRRYSTVREARREIHSASQWVLIWQKFRKHKLAVVGGIILMVLYAMSLFADFLAPYDIFKRYPDYAYCPPQPIRFVDENGLRLRPFVYGLKSKLDPDTFKTTFTVDRSRKYEVRLFVHGDPYEMWGFIRSDLHLFGAGDGPMFLFGTDELGRDLFSRTLHAARISLSVGLVGVFLSFILGCILGGISGYFGGPVDTFIQRVIEFLISIPTIPLWMGLAAALPNNWPPLRVYFGITLILSMIGWCGLGRVVRGKLLELREEDYVMAARLSGSTEWRIITKHLLPSFMSYLIVSLTLAIPNMILGETTLSFLGLGLRPPVVSWGVLLQVAQNVRSVSMHPWFLIPGLFVILTVLSFSFLGDGLRDAADPYR